jgi:hypothetical protein
MLTLEVALAQQFAQVEVTLPVLAQQDQPGDVIGILRGAEQHIGANDRFDARRLGGLVELDQRKQVVLVGDRDRWHAKLAGFIDQ